MLKIKKYKEEIKNFDVNKENLDCYLAEIATNQEGCNQGENCSTCLKNSLLKLLEEYKEPIELTKFEYEYLNYAKQDGFNYITRDHDGMLCMHSDKSRKVKSEWISYGTHCDVLNSISDSIFKFVKWEDEESYLIDEILNNCEVIEDEDE